jgi:hypothetical protein
VPSIENIGDQIEAALTAALNKHLGDDGDITWPLIVEINLSVTISPRLI